MPGSLLTMFLGWLATHLVALSALVFLAVWLVLSGSVTIPGKWAHDPPSHPGQPATSTVVAADNPTTEAVSASAAKPATAAAPRAGDGVRQPPPVDSMATDVTVTAPLLTDVPDPVRGQPRMIGGTIPVYGYARPPEGGVFRPPAATPAPFPMVLDYDELVQQARRAFWNGDFEAAERSYMAVVERYPEDADVYGELGNLYVAMGKNALALDAYFEAGVRLKAMGEQARSMEVAEILEKNGDDRARQLNTGE